MAEADTHINSKSLALRVEKKIASKMSTKRVANLFVDDTMGSVLDSLSGLVRQYTGSKREAERLLKDIIKVTLKVGILQRNGQFDAEELALAERFRKRFRTVVMTVVSFYEVAFSYDTAHLSELLQGCSTLLTELVRRHLQAKSLNRIDRVFTFFSNATFMDAVFATDTPLKPHLDKIVVGLNKLLDGGHL